MSTTSTILISGRLREHILESLQPLFGIGLACQREEHHVALAAQLLNHAPPPSRPASRLLVPIK